MRLVIQRVSEASVENFETGSLLGKINKGLFVLVGISPNDTLKEANNIAEKLLKLRIMSDEKGKMNLSVSDTRDGILVVSQSTLLADTSRGNRPPFIKAGDPVSAREIYEGFVSALRKTGLKVETGSFGNYMKISVVLDGPVTILI